MKKSDLKKSVSEMKFVVAAMRPREDTSVADMKIVQLKMAMLLAKKSAR